MCELTDRGGRHAGQLLGTLECVRLDGLPVILETCGGVLDEFHVGEALMDDLPAHRVRECNVAPHVDAQPHVGPLRGAGAAWADRVELRAVVAPAPAAAEPDRIPLPPVRAPP